MRTLDEFVKVYDDDLQPAFCRQLIQGFEQTRARHFRNGQGVRQGLEDSAWTELDIGALADPAFLGFFRQRIDLALERYNRDIGLTIAVPARPRTDRLILKRYRPGGEERFQPHFDSIDGVAARYLVFLWYLNDVQEGGETEFCDIGIRVSARTGRLLVFPPYWMFQHAGLPPVSGDKYILSTYLMF